MKKLIDRYTITLIKENILYLLLFILLFILSLFVYKVLIKKYLNQRTTTQKLEQEVRRLKLKSEILMRKKLTNNEIEEYIILLNHLVPETEDYFSIIRAMETLSKKSGFTITNYEISSLSLNRNLNRNRLPITVTGFGNVDAFTKMLKMYQFSTGRLITMDKLRFSSGRKVKMIKMNLTFNFYHQRRRKVKAKTPIAAKQGVRQSLAKEINTPVPKVDLDFLRKVKAKVLVDLKSELASKESEVLFYPTKTNPF